MQIVWDEPKRLANIDKHGFDLADVTEEFIVSATFFPAKLGRLGALAIFREKLMTAIIEPLGMEAIAVISFRPASSKEKREHWS
jgi:uncharacterized DUF497 family protein